MDDNYLVAEPTRSRGDGIEENPPTERTKSRIDALGISATAFARLMTKAFSDAATGGKQFDDVLKSLALRLSSMAVTQAFKPLAKGLAGSLSKMIGDLIGGGMTDGGGGKPAPMPGDVLTSSMNGIMPFASGGVIGTPTYFPLSSGGLGLAGEAGPEAIMPLTRGADGRLGVAMAGAGAPASITVQIATPDAASFRRSEAYLTGQIARAVARGQRSL
jgi:lambda family phage tail tape measure protein